MQATAVILAAGLGTRMKSSLPKTLHRLAGRTMLRHCSQAASRYSIGSLSCSGPDMDAVRQEAAPHICVVQQRTSGHRPRRAAGARAFRHGHVAVLYADNPLIRAETLRRLLDRPQRRRPGCRCWRSGPPTRAATAG